MPELPAFLADRMEPLFSTPARVVEIEEFGPRLRRVVFESPVFKRVRPETGYQVEFRVSTTAFRHYTLSDLDIAHGRCEMILFAHGEGPGSRWVRGLRAGDEPRLLGPGKPFSLDARASRHVLLGDESCLGLFRALFRSARGTELRGAVELDSGNEAWLERLGVTLEAQTRTALRGAALTGWLRRQAAPQADTTFYLAGHAQTVAVLRRQLLSAGVQRRAVHVRAYWADNKLGL
ncbi:MAG: siderophore-interacting protein [Myxococcaceae bacterium]